MQSLSEGAAARAQNELQPVPRVALVQSAGSPAATIPVPPPASGSWVKTAWATVLLAFEVLVSLFRGVARTAGRTIARPRTSGVRGRTSRIVSATLRLLLFLGMLAMLGGLATLLAVLFVARGRS
jgi:hypothetical protein